MPAPQGYHHFLSYPPRGVSHFQEIPLPGVCGPLEKPIQGDLSSEAGTPQPHLSYVAYPLPVFRVEFLTVVIAHVPCSHMRIMFDPSHPDHEIPPWGICRAKGYPPRGSVGLVRYPAGGYVIIMRYPAGGTAQTARYPFTPSLNPRFPVSFQDKVSRRYFLREPGCGGKFCRTPSSLIMRSPLGDLSYQERYPHQGVCLLFKRWGVCQE